MTAPIPATLPGSIPGLLRRGTVVHWRDEETPFVVTGPPFHDADDALWVIAAPCTGIPLGVQDDPSNFALDLDDATSRAHLAWWILAQPGMQERRPHHIVAGHFVAGIRQATNACERGLRVSPAQLDILTTVARHLAGLETA